MIGIKNISTNSQGFIISLLIILISVLICCIFPVIAPLLAVILIISGTYFYRLNTDVTQRIIAIAAIVSGIFILLMILLTSIFLIPVHEQINII